MFGCFKQRSAIVAESLNSCAGSVVESGPGRWKVSIANGRAVPVTAQLRGTWLRLDSALEAHAGEFELWKLLELNSALDGLAKFAVDPSDSAVHVLAELPLIEEIDLTGHLRRACAGIKEAHTQAHNGRAIEPMISHRVPSGTASPELSKLCEEAGWSCVVRSDGHSSIDLESRRGAYKAAVAPISDNAFKVSVELLRCGGLSNQVRLSLAALVLKACWFTGTARAAVDTDEGEASLVFETLLLGTAPAEELSCRLSYLSLACELCGKEVRALRDEALAGRYLSFCGWSFKPVLDRSS